MSCTNQHCFDICFKVVIDTVNDSVETFVDCGDQCSGIDIDFHDGIITIVLPLVACVDTTLNDDLSVSGQLVSLSFPHYL
ncbi:hypothetical protein WD019_16340 [Fictibacillus sp. Mic-4]|uniref:hypothetical protein n=1 Tax=Fictibacillus TaxID=1329200 RepID=UPI00047B9959|nr:hypothetical protein [Fictibacillus gelatini]